MNGPLSQKKGISSDCLSRPVAVLTGLNHYTTLLQVDTLKVGWCKIGDGDGAKALADLLMFNQTLSTVDLRGNILVPHVVCSSIYSCCQSVKPCCGERGYKLSSARYLGQLQCTPHLIVLKC